MFGWLAMWDARRSCEHSACTVPTLDGTRLTAIQVTWSAVLSTACQTVNNHGVFIRLDIGVAALLI